MQYYANQGWEVVSETIANGKFRGGRACCLFAICTPLAFLAGSTEGEIKVTIKKDTAKSYEPIVGLETDTLIKRAYMFLENGHFDNAGRYLNQALNQDTENVRAHIGQLILEHRVHNIDELIHKLDTLLEDEKLFQRALRFAKGDEKSRLESYAQSSRETIEQKRIAEEAEQKRLIAEREAAKAKMERLKEEDFD